MGIPAIPDGPANGVGRFEAGTSCRNLTRFPCQQWEYPTAPVGFVPSGRRECVGPCDVVSTTEPPFRCNQP